MPNIGAEKSCFAPAEHKDKSEQDFAAKLVKQMLRSNFGLYPLYTSHYACSASLLK
jgi:hypothetical protein